MHYSSVDKSFWVHELLEIADWTDFRKSFRIFIKMKNNRSVFNDNLDHMFIFNDFFTMKVLDPSVKTFWHPEEGYIFELAILYNQSSERYPEKWSFFFSVSQLVNSFYMDFFFVIMPEY